MVASVVGVGRRPDREQEALADHHRAQLATIKELLKDHSQIYQGGSSMINMEELGPPEPGMPINATMIRRHFQDHPNEMRAVGRYFLDSAEAESHILLEAKLKEWRRTMPWLVGPVDDIFFRSTAGHSDMDKQLEEWVSAAKRNTIHHSNRQREDAREAQDKIYILRQALNQLAWEFTIEGIQLYATRSTRKQIRKAEANDKLHDEWYATYKDLKSQGKKVKEIYDEIGNHPQAPSRSSLEKIISARESLATGEKKGPGRPKKEQEDPLVIHAGKIWVRPTKDGKSLEIGREGEVLRTLKRIDISRQKEPEKALRAHIEECAKIARIRRFVKALREGEKDDG